MENLDGESGKTIIKKAKAGRPALVHPSWAYAGKSNGNSMISKVDCGRRLLARRFSMKFHSIASLPMLVVDIAEKDDAFEITADLPGMVEKDIDVRTANGGLLIKRERKDQRKRTRTTVFAS